MSKSKKRVPKTVMTKRRIADLAKKITASRFAVWANNIFTVVYLINQVTELFERDLPTMVRFTLRRLGLSYTPNDELTIAGFTAVVARDTGVPFRDLSDAGKTKEDVYQFAAAQINEATGLSIERIDDPAYLKNYFATRTLEAARTGLPNTMMTVSFIRRMQHAARDALRDGLTENLGMPWSQRLYRFNHREAVRSYGHSHRQVWAFEDVVRKRKVFGRFRTVYTDRAMKQFWRLNNVQWRRQIRGLPFDQIIWPITETITYKSAPDLLTFTELQRLRKRIGLKPLHRRKSHPWRYHGNEAPNSFRK